MRLARFNSHPSGDPATDEAVAHYRELFENDESIDLQSCVAGMKIGESGYCGYWAVEVDSAGQYWLSPLSKVEVEAFDSSVFITRDRQGFKADFTQRVVNGRDRFYDHVVPVEYTTNSSRIYSIPLLEVAGSPEQLPGFYCDDEGLPPSAGENGELYTAYDTVDRFAEVRAIHKSLHLPIPEVFKPPFPGKQ